MNVRSRVESVKEEGSWREARMLVRLFVLFRVGVKRDREVGRKSCMEEKRGRTYQYKHAGLESARTMNTCSRRGMLHVFNGPIRVLPQSVLRKKRTWSVVGM
jgi:hypothetical protein